MYQLHGNLYHTYYMTRTVGYYGHDSDISVDEESGSDEEGYSEVEDDEDDDGNKEVSFNCFI